VCTVDVGFPGAVLVVSLSEDSYFAPGQTFAISFTNLFAPKGTDKCSQTGTPAEPRACTHLPGYGVVNGAYLVSPAVAQTLRWNLGNKGLTALPVHVSYRPLWPSSGPTSTVYADSIGLPLSPLSSYVVVDNSLNRTPGPNGGESITFYAEVQPALYERVVAPDGPFDAAFPPDVSQVTVAGGLADDIDLVAYDTTNQAIPTFNIARAEGLTGWTASLRDSTTLRRLSPVVPLSGPVAQNVALPTNHHPADGNALTGAELVVAPPSGKLIPTARFPSQAGSLASDLKYPTLAPLVTAQGSVTGADGKTPVEADLEFQATAIYENGPPPVLNQANFEYSAAAAARTDGGGPAAWTAVLPPGQYNVTARPLGPGTSVTVVQNVVVPPSDTPVSGVTLVLSPQQPVTGVVTLADQRPLSGATVEAIPTACAVAQATGTGCLPRSAETATSVDGRFSLLLDQGGYTLRIAPADGTGFGWYVQPILVQASPVSLTYVVDVPARASLVLHDYLDNPIVGAVVRVYDVPSKGAAFELGRAITDATGFYEMYLTPRAQ
jgi:hypothetical protein